MFNTFYDENGNCCRQYDKYEDLLEDLKPGNQLCEFLEYGIFRGQALDWKLLPSLYRDKIDNFYTDDAYDGVCNEENEAEYYNRTEYVILRNFYKKANHKGLDVPHPEIFKSNYLQIDDLAAFLNIKLDYNSNMLFFKDKEIQELAALAQHYGMKTRLLDWSSNFYIALFFAASGALKELDKDSSKSGNMVIWILPTIHIGSNVRNAHTPPINLIIPDYSKNQNICAQKGVLTLWTLANNNKDDFFEPLDIKIQKFNKCEKFSEFDPKFLLYKILIPINECVKILNHLKTIGYSSNTIYPWFDGIAKEYDDMYMIKKIEKQQHRKSTETNNNEKDVICIPLCNYKVSAGKGFDLENYDEWKEIEVERTYESERAKFCLEIQGDSMEPNYSDGDIVLVKRVDCIDVGEIGIFSKNDKGYIKKRGEDRWISLNPDYEDIYITEDDKFRFFGKVIGKAKVLSLV